MSIKLDEVEFFRFFKSYPKIKSNLIYNDSTHKIGLLAGFGLLFLGIIAFLILDFSTINLSSDPKESSMTDSISISPTGVPQKNQNEERFGNAFSIMPDQIEPGVTEPILENYDNIPKP